MHILYLNQQRPDVPGRKMHSPSRPFLNSPTWWELPKKTCCATQCQGLRELDVLMAKPAGLSFKTVNILSNKGLAMYSFPSIALEVFFFGRNKCGCFPGALKLLWSMVYLGQLMKKLYNSSEGFALAFTWTCMVREFQYLETLERFHSLSKAWFLDEQWAGGFGVPFVKLEVNMSRAQWF